MSLRSFLLFMLAFQLATIGAEAQPSRDYKRDWTWQVGSHYLMHFQNGTTPIYIPHTDSLPIWRVSDIANDTAGKIVMTTNGFDISDSLGNIVLADSVLCSGDLHDNYLYSGNAQQNTGIWLPDPISNDLWYYIYYKIAPVIWDHYYQLWFAKVNIHPRPTIVSQQLILSDSMPGWKASACRHANGRDWWVLAPKRNSNRFHRIYIGPQGPQYIGHQDIGIPYPSNAGQMCFSPDGNTLVDTDLYSIFDSSNVRIFDFDRCSGLLSNARQWRYLDTTLQWGCAISPNSRYLYLNTLSKVFQVNIATAHSRADMLFIDSLNPNCHCVIAGAHLGPDGKIYYAYNFSYIDYPDSAGTACHFNRSRLPSLPSNAGSWGLTAFPNFRLGAVVGSTCDTVLSTSMPQSGGRSFTVYPNPASSSVHIAIQGTDTGTRLEATLWDMQGRMVSGALPFYNDLNIDIAHLPAGMYLLRILDEPGSAYFTKVVKE